MNVSKNVPGMPYIMKKMTGNALLNAKLKEKNLNLDTLVSKNVQKDFILKITNVNPRAQLNISKKFI